MDLQTRMWHITTLIHKKHAHAHDVYHGGFTVPEKYSKQFSNMTEEQEGSHEIHGQ